MKLLTYDDLGDVALLVLNLPYLASWSGSRFLRKRIGDLDALLRVGRRKAIEDGFARAFAGAKSAEERRRLTRELFQRKWVGRGGMWRMLRSSAGGQARKRPEVQIEGLDHVHRALEGGRGAVIWSSGFGSPDTGARALLDEGLPLTVVEGPSHGGAPSWFGQRFIRPLYSSAEGRVFPDRVRISDTSLAYLSPLMQRLRRNGVIWMGNYGTSGRLFFRVDFLGYEQMFAGGVAGLAAVAKAPLIPAFCFQDGDGTRRLELREPFALPPAGFRTEELAPLVRTHAGMLEEYVRRYPLQWGRWHAPILESEVADIEGVTILDAGAPSDSGGQLDQRSG